MSDGAFLDVARRVPFSHGGSFRAVASHCWPEILAVIEAAREQQHGDMAWKYSDATVQEALDALDAKAEGL